MRKGLLDICPLQRSPAFRRLWIGTSAIRFSGQMAVVAVLYQVWELTRSPLWTGAIGVATAVPTIVLGLAGGTIADTFDRRRVVLLTSLGAVVSAGLLAAQAVAGIGSAVLVLVLVAAQTSCTALGSASRRAFVPRLLPQEQVAAGVALDHVAFQVAMLAGPAVAGVVLARWGLGWAYTVDAVTILLSLYGVVRLPSMRPEGGAVRAGLRATGEGLAFLWRRPALRGVLATDLAATVLAIPIALFPMINQERFGGDPQTLGLFLTAVAVGGTASGLLSGAVTGAARPGAVMLGSVGVWGLALAGFGAGRRPHRDAGVLSRRGRRGHRVGDLPGDARAAGDAGRVPRPDQLGGVRGRCRWAGTWRRTGGVGRQPGIGLGVGGQRGTGVRAGGGGDRWDASCTATVAATRPGRRRGMTASPLARADGGGYDLSRSAAPGEEGGAEKPATG
ncbi:MAG: hypothetical protein V7646_1348 [Pseudonocardia sp.]